MNDQRPFQTFIIRAHRRRTAWRIAEHATIGLLASSVVASIIVAIAWWRAIDAIAPVIAIMLIGIVAGIVASFWRQRNLLDTASLIEMQLGTPELISSAILTSQTDFAPSLHAMADARVAGVSLSSLVLRRLKLQAFLGAGFTSVCVLLLAMMAALPNAERTAVASDSHSSVDRWIADRAPSNTSASQLDPSGPTRPNQPDPDSRDASRSDAAQSTGTDAPRNAKSNTAANGSGSGTGRSNDATGRLAPEPKHVNATADDSGTLTASGMGTASSSPATGENASGNVNGSRLTQLIAPWQSSAWLADRDAALQAVQNGTVPDSYRLLVQDYFDRR